MKWTCLNDIYEFKSVTASRYIYYGKNLYPDGYCYELDLNKDEEVINQIFLPEKLPTSVLNLDVAEKVLRFSFNIYIHEEFLVLHTISNKGTCIAKFKSDSLYECIEQLHCVYNDLISMASSYKKAIEDFTSRKNLEQGYTAYNTWTRKLMKIFSVLFVIAVLSVTLICASYQEESSDKWYYLGVLTLNATVWTIFLLIDRHKILNLRKLQLKESERLNSKGYGTSDHHR